MIVVDYFDNKSCRKYEDILCICILFSIYSLIVIIGVGLMIVLGVGVVIVLVIIVLLILFGNLEK